ncbi:MAG: ATP-grasp domain-containing protein [Roseivirga sp.]
MNPRILISDIFLRKSFDAYNIIKARFPEHERIITVDKKLSGGKRLLKWLLFNDRCCKLSSKNYKQFESDLLAIQKQFAGEKIVYIPVEEKTTEFFLEYAHNHSTDMFLFVLPEADGFNTAKNKKELNFFCHQAGIPCPQPYKWSEIDTTSKDKLIFKPVEGSGSRGIYFKSPSELTSEDFAKKEKYHIQELLPNPKDVHGCFYLVKEGTVVSAYGHKRLRTFPETGGVTVLSRFNHNERALAVGTKLLEKLNWNGLAMVEFLYDDKDDQYKVIEINPRLWGSILLSEYANANLLTNYVLMSLKKELRNEHINPDTKIRWVFPYDFIYLLQRKISLKEFLYNADNVCFINWTYAHKMKALLFQLSLVFNAENISKYLKSRQKK